jgi:hypothetical protein
MIESLGIVLCHIGIIGKLVNCLVLREIKLLRL